MKQFGLKFKRYAESVGVINNNAHELALRAILVSFGVTALWYVFVLGGIVFNVMDRRTAEAESRALSSEVGKLELEYLALLNRVDLDYSYSLGFKEVKAQFATRKPILTVGLNSAGGSLGSINLAQNDL